MMFDLATAKTRLGIVGAAQDALLSATINAVISIAERYCDRKFLYAAETVKFYDFHGHMLFLPRYPIVSVLPSSTGLPTTNHVHGRLGVIELHGINYIEAASIDYVGGYQVLPEDLELALWLMFDALWPSMSGGGAGAAGGGAVKAIRSNGASIEYDTSGGAVSGLASSNAAGLPVGAMSILDTYRRETC